MAISSHLETDSSLSSTRDNPCITLVVGRPIEQARINGTQPEATQEFYTSYEDIIRHTNIRPYNMWNMDEHGIAIGVCTNL